jgi:hypothetical protein
MTVVVIVVAVGVVEVEVERGFRTKQLDYYF